MLRRGKLVALLGVSCVTSLFALAPSCTVWNGVELPAGAASGAGADAPDADTPEKDAGTGAGGDQADAPDPALDALHFLDPLKAARLCALLSRCELLPRSLRPSALVPVDPSNYSQCMTWLAGPIPTSIIGFAYRQKTLECMADAVTCESAGACGAYEAVNDDDPRCLSPSIDTPCDSPRDARDCASGFVYHCNQANGVFPIGSRCLVDDQGNEACATETSATGCRSACDEGTYRWCEHGLTREQNCEAIGETCGANWCLHDGQPGYNAQPSESMCVDGVIQMSNFNRTSFDCGALGGSCDAALPWPSCALPGKPCDPYSTTDAKVNTCEGKILNVCIGGEYGQVDCDELGPGFTCQSGGGPGLGYCWQSSGGP